MTNSPILTATQSGSSCRDVENLLGVLQRCVPNFESIVRLSFDSRENITENWNAWCEKVAHPLLLPLMKKVHAHALAGHVREIVELDNALTLQPPSSLEKLQTEGRRLLFSHLPPKCERTLQRYFAHAQKGETPACFPVVHALRGAIFHAPFAMVAESYIFLEAFLAAGNGKEIQPGNLLERFLQSSSAGNLHAA